MMLDLYSIVNNKLLGERRKSLGNKIFFILKKAVYEKKKKAVYGQ